MKMWVRILLSLLPLRSSPQSFPETLPHLDKLESEVLERQQGAQEHDLAGQQAALHHPAQEGVVLLQHLQKVEGGQQVLGSVPLACHAGTVTDPRLHATRTPPKCGPPGRCLAPAGTGSARGC